MILAGPRAGARSSRTNRPSRNDDSRSGASRKSSADRDGGRVDDDQVVGPGRLGVPLELAELLHRHVLLRARERARQRDVEGVLEDLLGLLRGGLALHDLVEGPLHVQHHRVEAAAVVGGAADADDRPRGVVERLDAHRLGQPAGRVDGEDHDLPAALGGPERQRRGRGGLADAARAAADDDAGGGVVEQRVDVERLRRRGVRGQRADAGVGAGHARPWSWRRRRPARRARRGRRRPASLGSS